MIASIELGAVLEAEDGAQDCLEGDRLHGAMKGERASDRPRVDRAVGDVPHERAVGLHALAV